MTPRTELQPSILAAELVYGLAPEIPQWLRIAEGYTHRVVSMSTSTRGWTIQTPSGAEVLIPFRQDLSSKNRQGIHDFLPEGLKSCSIPTPPWPGVALKNVGGIYVGNIKDGMVNLFTAWEVIAYVLWLHEGQPSEVDRDLLFWAPPNYKTDSVARAGLIEAAFQRLPEDMLTRVSARLGKPWLWMSPEVVDALAEEATR